MALGPDVADHTETTKQSQRLVQRLKEAGMPARAFPAAGKNHGTIDFKPGTPGDEPTEALFEFLEGVSGRTKTMP